MRALGPGCAGCRRRAAKPVAPPKSTEPAGYREFPIAPAAASFNTDFGEFVLPYEAMRQSIDPDAALLQFLQTTYDAAAECAHWDRAALDVGAAQQSR